MYKGKFTKLNEINIVGVNNEINDEINKSSIINI